MAESSLGDTLIALGLLTEAQVADLRREVADGTPLADLAVERGWLDDDGVARGWAQLFRLNMVPAERVERLGVAPPILGLLPADLMRQHLLVPTFLDAERRVLSLLTADPTALEALQAAQAASQAARLRLFVAPRRSIRQLLDRILPDARPVTRSAPPTTPLRAATIAFEPSAERATLLRQLAAVEGGSVEVCVRPSQVTALLEAGRAERILYRTAVEREVEGELESWRQSWADMPVGSIDGWGPGYRYAIPYQQARTFLIGLLEAVLVGDAAPDSVAERARRTAQLARDMAATLDLPVEVRDTVNLAALLADVGELRGRSEGAVRFGAARELLRQLDSPYPVDELFAALERRLGGAESPGRHLGAEVLYTARAAVAAGVRPGEDPVPRLGPDAARHHGPALRALTEVLRREGLLTRVATADGSTVVLLADRDAAFVASARTRLGAAGLSLVVVGDAAEARRQAAQVQPAALLLSASLPGMSTFALLDALRQDERTQELPVILIGDPGQDLAAGLERGAEDVMERPVRWELLVARLRRAVQRRSAATSAAIVGRLADLSLVDLLQTLTLGAKTAVVKVSVGNEGGEVQVRGGRLVAARMGPWEGEEALNALVDLPDGRFEVRFRDSGLTNLRGSSEYLLLEAVRLRDERRGH